MDLGEPPSTTSAVSQGPVSILEIFNATRQEYGGINYYNGSTPSLNAMRASALGNAAGGTDRQVMSDHTLPILATGKVICIIVPTVLTSAI